MVVILLFRAIARLIPLKIIAVTLMRVMLLICILTVRSRLQGLFLAILLSIFLLIVLKTHHLLRIAGLLGATL
jgi:hypothetical protein